MNHLFLFCFCLIFKEICTQFFVYNCKTLLVVSEEKLCYGCEINISCTLYIVERLACSRAVNIALLFLNNVVNLSVPSEEYLPKVGLRILFSKNSLYAQITNPNLV